MPKCFQHFIVNINQFRLHSQNNPSNLKLIMNFNPRLMSVIHWLTIICQKVAKIRRLFIVSAIQKSQKLHTIIKTSRPHSLIFNCFPRTFKKTTKVNPIFIKKVHKLNCVLIFLSFSSKNKKFIKKTFSTVIA